jgi:hypothetical protein
MAGCTCVPRRACIPSSHASQHLCLPPLTCLLTSLPARLLCVQSRRRWTAGRTCTPCSCAPQRRRAVSSGKRNAPRLLAKHVPWVL